MLYKFVHATCSKNEKEKVVRESCVNVSVPKHVSRVSRKGIGSMFPHIGSRVPGEGSQIQVPSSRVPYKGPGSWVQPMGLAYGSQVSLSGMSWSFYQSQGSGRRNTSPSHRLGCCEERSFQCNKEKRSRTIQKVYQLRPCTDREVL